MSHTFTTEGAEHLLWLQEVHVHLEVCVFCVTRDSQIQTATKSKQIEMIASVFTCFTNSEHWTKIRLSRCKNLPLKCLKMTSVYFYHSKFFQQYSNQLKY